jgi:hypothetical protein
MKLAVAVTVTVCRQIGPSTGQDFHTTKVFEENSTIKEIDDWIKSIDKNGSFSNAKISLCVD